MNERLNKTVNKIEKIFCSKFGVTLSNGLIPSPLNHADN